MEYMGSYNQGCTEEQHDFRDEFPWQLQEVSQLCSILERSTEVLETSSQPFRRLY